MKAIQTKYLPCTNTKGSRIKAFTGEKGQTVTIGYPHELSGEAVHAKAAVMLRDKMGWKGELIGGGLPNGDHVFCFAQGERHGVQS